MTCKLVVVSLNLYSPAGKEIVSLASPNTFLLQIKLVLRLCIAGLSTRYKSPTQVKSFLVQLSGSQSFIFTSQRHSIYVLPSTSAELLLESMRITGFYLAHWRQCMRLYFVLMFFFPFIARGQD